MDPVRGVPHALERLSVGRLVASSGLLDLFLGLLNVARWQPWPYSFPQTHCGRLVQP